MKYQANNIDLNGNVRILSVEDGRVSMKTPSGLPLPLASVGFLIDVKGVAAQEAAVRDAALVGVQALRSVTRLAWALM